MLWILAEDLDLASGAPTVALEDLDGGRLPRAVRAEEREYLSPGNVQVYPADSLN